MHVCQYREDVIVQEDILKPDVMINKFYFCSNYPYIDAVLSIISCVTYPNYVLIMVFQESSPVSLIAQKLLYQSAA